MSSKGGTVDSLRLFGFGKRLQGPAAAGAACASVSVGGARYHDRGNTHWAFLGKNPNGRIPTLELDDGTCIAESDAILWYLADGTAFLPEDRLARAQVLQWM